MASLDFEEYRQPWETGPHWELKREFLEHYKDNFPEDRLLCLAQAYSNIVLLHCSYPAPVMIQVHELSKSLKGCKKFRSDQNSQNSNTSSQGRQGKRCSDSGDSKKYKFIKFCSGENKLLSGENPSNISSTVNLYADDTCPVNNSSLNINNSSIHQSKDIDNCSTASLNIDYSSIRQSKDINNCSIVSLNIDYSSIHQSKDFQTIYLLASQVQKFIMVKKKNAIDILQSSATLLKIKNLIQYKFANKTLENSDAKMKKCICEFLVGSTRIAVAEGNSVDNAKKSAAEQALKILMNFENMPTKNLNALQSENSDLNSKQSNSDLLFLQKFAQHLKSNMKTNQTAVSLINMTGLQMKISDSLEFNITGDLNSPNHNCNFFCNFSVKDISISQGKASSKKRAKQEAAENGIKYLLNLLESNNNCALKFKNTKENNVTDDKMFNLKNENLNISKLKQEKINPRSSIYNTFISDGLDTNNFTKEDCSIISNSDELNKSDLPPTKPLLGESRVKPHSFKLNKQLLQNSFRRQLVLFDRSEIESIPQSDAAIMSQSSQQCRKCLSYELVKISDVEYKANLLLDKEIVASGIGTTGKLAKSEAAKSAVKILRKNVYTLKVKNDLEESFVISRAQMSKFDTDDSRTISEGNVGHKMLKMMGWSGGGIGKYEGRTEPVMVNDIRPGRGLGFKDQVNNNMTRKQFSQRIETLLKDFSQSNLMNVLIFSPDFLKTEREMIHKIAMKFNLTHTSYGKEERQLCIRRKHSITELLDFIMQSGGSTDKYELVDMST